MYLKIHESYRAVVALCDENLLGKKFEEGKRQLEVRERFFKGDSLNKEEAINLLKRQQREDSTFNIVGEESVKVAIEIGLIDKNQVAMVGGIPFALVLF